MNQERLERRSDLLKQEGDGFTRREIVKSLSAKYGCTEATVYNDFATRAHWQPLLLEMKASVFKLQNRHEQLYRKASSQYFKAKSIRDRIAALNLMRQINVDLAELSGAKPFEEAATEEINIKWEDPEEFKQAVLQCATG